MQFQMRVTATDFPNAIHIVIVGQICAKRCLHHHFDEFSFRKWILGRHINLQCLGTVCNVSIYHFDGSINGGAGNADIVNDSKSHM